MSSMLETAVEPLLIPMDRFRPIVERWLAGHELPDEAFRELEAASPYSADAWYRRLSERASPGQTRGWFSLLWVDAGKVDEFLTAAGLTHLWQSELHDLLPALEAGAVVPPVVACEDCGCEVERGVEPLGLFRPVAGARQGIVWDATKQKWVERPHNAAANGRRWREYVLCRLCRAEALRRRSANGGGVKENGRRRALRTRERLAPKKGGRPRLLTDEELAAAYRIYLGRGLSILELARRFDATREKGTMSGYTQAIMYGWRRLGYQLRPRGEQIGISRFGTDGTKSKPQMRRCDGLVQAGERKGKRCRLFAMRDEVRCYDHRAA